jgi:hypothetical protein
VFENLYTCLFCHQLTNVAFCWRLLTSLLELATPPGNILTIILNDHRTNLQAHRIIAVVIYFKKKKVHVTNQIIIPLGLQLANYKSKGHHFAFEIGNLIED